MPPEPGLPTDPPDPTAAHCDMLGELAGIGMAMARVLGQQVQATGRVGPEDVAMLQEVSRAVRRTIALHQKLYADSRMSDEARATERMRRADAAGRASLRVRKDAVRRAVEDEIKADAAARGASDSDTERLLCDLRERLMDPDIDRAFTDQDNSAIILGICKDLSITPRNATWSDRKMQVEIAETSDTLRRFAEGLTDPGVPVVPEPAPPGGYPKIGRFTFGPTGAVVRVDPPEGPLSDWEILKGRDPPDSG